VLGSTFSLISGMPTPVVYGLLLGEHNLTSGCHGHSMTANFSPPVCSPTGEAGKNVQTGFIVICGMPQTFSRDLRPATIVYSEGQRIKFHLYSECEFFKNCSF
jgi:hypothetical protein